MPCTDNGVPYPDDRQERLDKATRLLCLLGNAVLNSSITFIGDLGLEAEEAEELVDWINDHNVLDARRRQEEAEKIRQQRQKSKALRKLTKEERDLLGL